MPSFSAFFANGTSLSVTVPERNLYFIYTAGWIQRYLIIPLMVVVFYDYLLTIPDEVNALWKRKKSVASVSILISRYALLAYATIPIILSFPLKGDPLFQPLSRCTSANLAIRVLRPVLAAGNIIFDTLRIYAIMHKNMLPAPIVAILGIAGFAFTIATPDRQVLMVFFSNGQGLGCEGFVTIEILDIRSLYTGNYLSPCHIMEFPTDPSPEVLYAKFAANIAFEAAVLSITVLQTLRYRRDVAAIGIHKSLHSLLLRDGSFQFGLILLISIIDIALLRFVQEPIDSSIAKSVITIHLAFHLRQTSPGFQLTQYSISYGSVRFNSAVLGNVGAPLHSVFSDTHDEGELDESGEIYLVEAHQNYRDDETSASEPCSIITLHRESQCTTS